MYRKILMHILYYLISWPFLDMSKTFKSGMSGLSLNSNER